VQVNGKVRSRIVVPVGSPATDVEAAALADAKVAAAIGGATPQRVIVVPGRLVNVVL
jgi:leucyl-tRNA synthetase